jgi:hypothetical protein
MRIGLDLGDAPAYCDLLSFLSPAEYGALLEAAGFSPDASPVAVTGTADPLLFECAGCSNRSATTMASELPWPRALRRHR